MEHFNNLGVSLLSHGAYAEASKALKQALVHAKHAAEDAATDCPPPPSSKNGNIKSNSRLVWAHVEASIRHLCTAPIQNEDSWSIPNGVPLPPKAVLGSHHPEADSKIRSGIIIFNLALCFQLWSAFDSSRARQYQAKALCLYEKAYELLVATDEDCSGSKTDEAMECLISVVLLASLNNMAAMRASHSPRTSDTVDCLVYMIAQVQSQSFWCDCPLRKQLETLIQQVALNATCLKVGPITTAAAA